MCFGVRLKLKSVRRAFVVAVLLLVCAAEVGGLGRVRADEKSAPKLPAGVRMERDLAYVEGGDESQKLDLYLPEQPAAGPLPLIVHIHGGGWRGGSKFPCPFLVLVNRGYAVASIEYRFSQKAVFPAQIQDCQAAIRWLRGHAGKYGLDAEKVGVIGGSAGGHLSALVGTAGGAKAFPQIGGFSDQPDDVQCVCDIFGPANFATVMQQAADDKNVRNIFKFNSDSDPYALLIGGNLETDREKVAAVSPVHYITADDPPTLILHGTHDALVPYAQSVELAESLRAKGVPVWLQTLPGSGQGGAACSKPSVMTLMGNFFDRHLRGVDVEIRLVPESELAVDPPADRQ
ncbi:MAG: alpha/beta hydrolase fold domain-containing protein [Planctomyces sp.]